MSALYPDVPFFPGVPAVLRAAVNSFQPVPKLTSDSDQIDRLSALYWGIFTQDGQPAVEPDNVVAIEDGVEYRIADYPLEAGAFESYNKVATPRAVRIAMSKGGSLGDRRSFLDTLRSLAGNLELYNVVTPEETFTKMNIASVRKARNQANGATMLTVEIMLQEIRVQSTAPADDAKSPSSASDYNAGSVQPSDIVVSITSPPADTLALA